MVTIASMKSTDKIFDGRITKLEQTFVGKTQKQAK